MYIMFGRVLRYYSSIITRSTGWLLSAGHFKLHFFVEAAILDFLVWPMRGLVTINFNMVASTKMCS